ncbi:hypothetical protein EIN_094980 [Entamoeba invadens IP1]|uniref:Uncharacterized protein n=1 Tax=Entamoeba invadens IP1 TaxID=370355 RepID=A0A0A1U602_ENTIV|nr:hypothetical protein EIN_094980 [Entamoeba invadens IP1]ELP87261.1 hypothetical protein EIN_094980 [Entamoeba invadens IP1]|eukprot:XP_004254032.1 hypothetical protein EIN_094980 [Entamoeba invadens IP1]
MEMLLYVLFAMFLAVKAEEGENFELDDDYDNDYNEEYQLDDDEEEFDYDDAVEDDFEEDYDDDEYDDDEEEFDDDENEYDLGQNPAPYDDALFYNHIFGNGQFGAPYFQYGQYPMNYYHPMQRIY